MVLSKNSVDSPWVKHELNAALARELELQRVFVLPVRIDDAELPVFLKDKIFADFRKSYASGLRILLHAIKTRIQDQSSKSISEGHRILWLDNDTAYMFPYIDVMLAAGFEVDIAKTVTEAGQLLQQHIYSLVILDMMIPIKNEEEESIYSLDSTKGYYETGLIFYINHKAMLRNRLTKVLFLTVRLDDEILRHVIDQGVPRHAFATKLTLRDTSLFLDSLGICIFCV